VAGSVGALSFTGKANPTYRSLPAKTAGDAPSGWSYLVRTGLPMRNVARKMVNAPSDVIALPMTGMVDIDSIITYM